MGLWHSKRVWTSFCSSGNNRREKGGPRNDRPRTGAPDCTEEVPCGFARVTESQRGRPGRRVISSSFFQDITLYCRSESANPFGLVFCLSSLAAGRRGYRSITLFLVPSHCRCTTASPDHPVRALQWTGRRFFTARSTHAQDNPHGNTYGMGCELACSGMRVTIAMPSSARAS